MKIISAFSGLLIPLCLTASLLLAGCDQTDQSDSAAETSPSPSPLTVTATVSSAPEVTETPARSPTDLPVTTVTPASDTAVPSSGFVSVSADLPIVSTPTVTPAAVTVTIEPASDPDSDEASGSYSMSEEPALQHSEWTKPKL